MGVTEKLARFVVDTSYESIPEEAAIAAKRAILDTLAVTIAGCREDASRIITAYVRELGGDGRPCAERSFPPPVPPAVERPADRCRRPCRRSVFSDFS